MWPAWAAPSVDSNVHGEMLDAASLFRWAFLNLSSKTITSQGDILADVPLDYAWQKDTLQLAAGENVSVMLPNSVDTSSIIVETDLPESVQAPIEKGEQVGTATMSYAGEVIATVPLVAAESVSRSEMLSLYQPKRLGAHQPLVPHHHGGYSAADNCVYHFDSAVSEEAEAAAQGAEVP